MREVVPPTKAWAPKTNMITSATGCEATTAIGAATAAVLAWAGAGPGRGALEPYLLRALAPLADGFERSS